MAKAPSQGTLDYLTDAAFLMRTSAPETSAHLMSQRNHLLAQHNEFPSDIDRQRVCTACGFIMSPSDGLAMTLRPRRARPAVRRPNNQKKTATTKLETCGPTKVLTCSHCHRVTRVKMPAPPAPFRSRKDLERKVISKPTQSQGPITQPASANANSKKRAKNRKSGLQALLSSSQQQRQNGASLSLADFT